MFEVSARVSPLAAAVDHLLGVSGPAARHHLLLLSSGSVPGVFPFDFERVLDFDVLRLEVLYLLSVAPEVGVEQIQHHGILRLVRVLHRMVLVDLAEANKQLPWLRGPGIAIRYINACAGAHVMRLNLPGILIDTLRILTAIVIIVIVF